MLRLTCVANMIADIMRSGHRPTPAQTLKVASAARPRSWLSWQASPIPNNGAGAGTATGKGGVGRRSRSRLPLSVEQNKLISWRRVNRVYEADIERG